MDFLLENSFSVPDILEATFINQNGEFFTFGGGGNITETIAIGLLFLFLPLMAFFLILGIMLDNSVPGIVATILLAVVIAVLFNVSSGHIYKFSGDYQTLTYQKKENDITQKDLNKDNQIIKEYPFTIKPLKDGEFELSVDLNNNGKIELAEDDTSSLNEIHTITSYQNDLIGKKSGNIEGTFTFENYETTGIYNIELADREAVIDSGMNELMVPVELTFSIKQ